jgi:hypothetical protein
MPSVSRDEKFFTSVVEPKTLMFSWSSCKPSFLPIQPQPKIETEFIWVFKLEFVNNLYICDTN